MYLKHKLGPRFVFTQIFGICHYEQSWVKHRSVLTRVELELVCAMQTGLKMKAKKVFEKSNCFNVFTAYSNVLQLSQGVTKLTISLVGKIHNMGSVGPHEVQ